MSIENVAGIISRAIIERNPGILKAGLIELAVEQGVMVKSKMIFFTGVTINFDQDINREVERLVKDKGYHLHHLDAIILIVDLESVVKGVVVNGPAWNSYFNGGMGSGLAPNQMMGFNAPNFTTIQSEIIIFSETTPAGQDFRLFDELGELYNKHYSQMNDSCYRGPTYNAPPSPSTVNINGEVHLKSDRHPPNEHQGGW